MDLGIAWGLFGGPLGVYLGDFWGNIFPIFSYIFPQLKLVFRGSNLLCIALVTGRRINLEIWVPRGPGLRPKVPRARSVGSGPRVVFGAFLACNRT